MLNLIGQFQKDATKLGRDENSVEEFKMWVKAISGKGILTNKGEIVWRKDFNIEGTKLVAYIEEIEDGRFGGVIDKYNTDETQFGDYFDSFDEAKKVILEEIQAMRNVEWFD